MIGYDHKGIRATVSRKVPGMGGQRCVVHFRPNVLPAVPDSAVAEVGEDLSVISEAKREKTAHALAEEFISLCRKRCPKAAEVFEAGPCSAVTYLRHPGSHYARTRSTIMLERFFEEGEERASKCYVTMNTLEAVGKPNPQYSRYPLGGQPDVATV